MKRAWIPSPNYSSRGGSAVRLVVVHTAEGARTYKELGSFFANPSSQVSSHTGIDDTAGTIGEYVKRPNKAWTQGDANPYSVSVELCAFAEWAPETWATHDQMLTNCAIWIREECQHYGIPIVKLSANQAQGGGRGVCGHVDLGAAGGGHWDPGPGFPWSEVLRRAKGESAKPDQPLLRAPMGAAAAATMEGDEMPPEYLINDQRGKRKLGVYSSGLVRELQGPEFGYLRDHLDVRILDMDNPDASDRLFQYDQALRGQVKERS